MMKNVISGRFRRYHGMSRWHLLRPAIFFPNLVDLFKVIAGFVQSVVGLILWQPDVVFLKGGYVCLPVGYAARMLRIPIVLHDSDAHPGLTSRLIAPFADKIGTGAPREYYDYPKGKTKHVGIPVSPEFREYSDQERTKIKQKLGFDSNRPLVVVTGGGLGAVRINNAIAESRELLLESTSVFLISGDSQYDELKSKLTNLPGWRLEAFVHSGMAEILSAADLVVARAGATTLAELSALHKPTIIVPNRLLTAGHQMKNAKVYQDGFAAIIVDEQDIERSSEVLARQVINLLQSEKIIHELGQNFGKFAKPEAAKDMAQMIISSVYRRKDTKGV